MTLAAAPSSPPPWSSWSAPTIEEHDDDDGADTDNRAAFAVDDAFDLNDDGASDDVVEDGGVDDDNIAVDIFDVVEGGDERTAATEHEQERTFMKRARHEDSERGTQKTKKQ